MKYCHSLLCGLFLMLLTSCEDRQEPSSEILELREELKELSEKQEKSARKKSREKDQQEQKKILESLELEIKELKQSLAESDDELVIVKKEKMELEHSLQDIEQELEDSMSEFVQRARTTDLGRKFSEVRSGDVIYRDAEIVEFIKNSVRIRHKSGFATLTSRNAPRAWVKKYYLDPSEQRGKKKEKAKIAKTPEDTPVGPEATSGQVSISKAQDAVVIISGDRSSGTGFFVKSGSGIYLYTAAHVLAGNSLRSLEFVTRSGRKYRKFGKLEIAHGVDVARLHVGESVPFALSLPKRNSIVNGLPFVGLGNPGGGTVVTADSGMVRAVGPKSFELDASLVKGNSGGPIVRENTKVAIGLVTHALIGKGDEVSSGTRYAKVRRFGARLDVPLKWHRSSLSSFLAEPSKLKKISKVTRLLFALSELRSGRNGLRLNVRVSGGGGRTALSILKENSEMRVVQRILKMNRSLAEKKIKPDQRSINKHFRSLLSQALSAAKSRVLSIKNSGTSPYHMERAKGMFELHAKAVKALDQSMSRIGR